MIIWKIPKTLNIVTIWKNWNQIVIDTILIFLMPRGSGGIQRGISPFFFFFEMCGRKEKVHLGWMTEASFRRTHQPYWVQRFVTLVPRKLPDIMAQWYSNSFVTRDDGKCCGKIAYDYFGAFSWESILSSRLLMESILFWRIWNIECPCYLTEMYTLLLIKKKKVYFFWFYNTKYTFLNFQNQVFSAN